MKTNELMIGNLIRLKNEYYEMPKGTIMRVVEVFTDSVFCQDINIEFEALEVPDYLLEPIPLTPEILKKNGFVYSFLPFEQSWQQFGLSLYHGGDGYRINCGENVAMIVDYVHQLQHALCLCGIEKEIEL